MDLAIAIETPDQPEVLLFLAASDAYHAERYPAESNHTLPVTELLAYDVTFPRTMAMSDARIMDAHFAW